MEPPETLAAVSQLQAVAMGCLVVLSKVGTCVGCSSVQLKHPLVKKWSKGLPMRSKHLVCKGEQLTSVSGPALVTCSNGCRPNLE